MAAIPLIMGCYKIQIDNLGSDGGVGVECSPEEAIDPGSITSVSLKFRYFIFRHQSSRVSNKFSLMITVDLTSSPLRPITSTSLDCAASII